MQAPMQSWAFVLFVLASVALYWTVVPKRWRPHYLLVLSLGYYLVNSLSAFGLTFIFLLFYLYGMWVVGVLIDTAKTKGGRLAWVIVGVGAAAGTLLIFKTTATLTKIIFQLFGLGGGQIVAMAFAKFGVPLGISYFSFRVIHYLIEVYRGRGQRASAVDFFLYITFFPTMISGPIHRFFALPRENAADAFGPQLSGGTPAYRADDLTYGMWRILQGVVKKFVIADFFMRMSSPILNPGMLMSTETWQLWIATHCYFVYLYIDFSGYSDLAIGIARLFGFRVMENFNWPILAPNVREFWRRWHISLTEWLMQYVYFPLGGGRKGNVRTDINIFITIVGVALWHTVSAHMLLWGVIEGLAMVAFRHWDRFKRRIFPDRKPTWWGKLIGIIMVWHLHGILWPLFHHKVRIAMLYWAKMIPIFHWLGGGAAKLTLGG